MELSEWREELADWSERALGDRFWSKVDTSGECWIWLGPRNSKGYGVFHAHAARAMAHRIAYEWRVGKIPKGLVIDHLCRVPSCVRPDHLEAVTNRINVLRGIGSSAECAKRSHCEKGHEYVSGSFYMKGPPGRKYRSCRICRNEYKRAQRRAARLKDPA